MLENLVLSEINDNKYILTNSKYYFHNMTVIKNLLTNIIFKERMKKYIIIYHDKNIFIKQFSSHFENHLGIINIKDNLLEIRIKTDDSNNYKVFCEKLF